MDVEILSWKSKGLRCPDLEINLEGAGKNLTLLQMPNGTGKTTTLNLIKKCFHEDTGLSKEEILEFRRTEEDNDKGEFELKLNVNNQTIIILLNFNFKEGKLSYQTSGAHTGGLQPGLILPNEILNVVDKKFVDLLFFDLEFARGLFKNQRTEAKNAIEKLCKAHLIDETIKDLKNFLTDERKKQRQTRDQVKLKAKQDLENDLTALEEKKEKQDEKLKKVEEWLKNESKKISELKVEIQEYLDEYSESRNRIETAKKNEQNKYDAYKDYLNECFQKIKNIGNLNENFYNNLKNFYTGLEKLKLPQADAEQFFDELLDPDNKICICGEHLNDEKRQTINDRKKEFLSSEDTGVINSIKNKINKVDDFKEDISKIINKITKYQFDYDEAKQRRISTETTVLGESKVKKQQSELNKLREEKVKKEEEKKRLQEPWSKDDGISTESIISLIKQINEKQIELSKISGTLKITQQANKLINLLEKSKDEAVQTIADELVDECNKKIEIMLSEDPIFISKIDNYLILKGNQKQGSVGQEARIGYVFLTTLLDRTTFKFPLIVDSPVTGMDGRGREVTSEFIVSLKGQYIGFIIDTEKKDFADNLFKLKNGQINCITAYRKTVTTYDWDLQAKNYVNDFGNFTNGIVINGKEFFDKFTLTKEGK